MSRTTDLRRSPGATRHDELQTPSIGVHVDEKYCHLMRPTPRRTPAR